MQSGKNQKRNCTTVTSLEEDFHQHCTIKFHEKKYFSFIYFGFGNGFALKATKSLHLHKKSNCHYHATIHTATGTVLNNASIVFENRKITQINGSYSE